ncbi:hypothetical protein B296_00036828 [Ensete ventricosum]|uniref:Protein SPIRAL1-like 1 n=1 Tax=Ensete ventricosum TaxID=4639 RepID=A0A426ZQG9_ENSVE|nr:hypothetical protein B296_00036828 [Ensete ventricosum]
MGRGVSSEGGQSSLGYLFGGSEAFKPASDDAAPVQKSAPPSPINKEIPAGIQSSQAKNTAIEQMDITVAILSLYDITGSTSFNFQYK